MNCPDCVNAPLEEKAHAEDLLVDLCPACGGIWLDGGELERYGKKAPGLKELIALAEKTLLPTARPCLRCSEVLQRGWMDEPKLEYKCCPACQGMWIDRERLKKLRAFLKSKQPKPAQEPVSPPFWTPKTMATCAALVGVWLMLRTAGSPPKASAPAEPAKTYRYYERQALMRRANAVVAEKSGQTAAAEEEYHAAADFYYAAILAAPPKEAWRLDLEYSNMGEPLARMAARQQRFDEAEKIYNICLEVFRRHGDLAGQSRVQQSLELLAAARKSYKPSPKPVVKG